MPVQKTVRIVERMAQGQSLDLDLVSASIASVADKIAAIMASDGSFRKDMSLQELEDDWSKLKSAVPVSSETIPPLQRVETSLRKMLFRLDNSEKSIYVRFLKKIEIASMDGVLDDLEELRGMKPSRAMLTNDISEVIWLLTPSTRAVPPIVTTIDNIWKEKRLTRSPNANGALIPWPSGSQSFAGALRTVREKLMNGQQAEVYEVSGLVSTIDAILNLPTLGPGNGALEERLGILRTSLLQSTIVNRVTLAARFMDLALADLRAAPVLDEFRKLGDTGAAELQDTTKALEGFKGPLAGAVDEKALERVGADLKIFAEEMNRLAPGNPVQKRISQLIYADLQKILRILKGKSIDRHYVDLAITLVLRRIDALKKQQGPKVAPLVLDLNNDWSIIHRNLWTAYPRSRPAEEAETRIRNILSLLSDNKELSGELDAQFMEKVLNNLQELRALELKGPVASSNRAMLSDEQSNYAMMGEPPVGGIDITNVNASLQIKRDGNGVALPINMQPLETINANFQGFVPLIINIKPMTNLPMLLGVAAPEAEEQLSSL